ncbi:MAG: O-antigen ligase family protein [Clostridia bacterium]|nr:O-antigen ligase family protein [Clostridia bacterium]
MTLIFALLPVYAIFSPQQHGEIFIFLSKIEITALAVCLAVYLYNYFFVFPNAGESSKIAQLCYNLKSYFAKNKHALLLLVVYVCTVISVFLAPNRHRALMGTEFRPDGLLMHTAFLALFIFSSYIKDNFHKKCIYAAYVFGFILTGLIMIQQYYGIIGTAGQEPYGAFGEWLNQQYIKADVFIGHFFKGTTGSFYNLNHMGYYIIMCSMLSVGMYIKAEKKASKIMSGIFMAFTFWVLVLNNTFGAYLAALGVVVVVFVILFFRLKSRFTTAIMPFAVFLAVSVAVTLVSSSDSLILKNFTTLGSDVVNIASSDSGDSSKDDSESGSAGSGRWSLWVNTVEMIGEKPLFGWGPDNLADEYKAREAKLDRAHCEPLERAVSTGILSGLCYVAAVAYVIWTRLMRKDHLNSHTSIIIPLVVVFGYSVSALVGVFLFYTACHYMIFMGMLTERQ